MILSVNNIDKTYIDNHVLRNVSFHLNEYDKAALIGINGCGKSTLLKIIMGLEQADDGQCILAKDTTIGYLAQNSLVESDKTIYEEVLSIKQRLIDMESEINSLQNQMEKAEGDSLHSLIEKHTQLLHDFDLQGGYVYKSEVRGVLMGLGFDESEFGQKINTLSGGQKTRVALSKLLLNNPDLIILDEPTNHLDMNSVIWLENYLLNYKGTVFIVSHDRYFLDKIVNKVIDLENGTIQTYDGNYTDFAIKKESLRIAQLNAYNKQADMIKHQEEVIAKLRSFNREKSIKRAESRVKALDKIEKLDKPVEMNDSMSLTLTPRIESGKDVLNVENLCKAFYDNHLFSNISFSLRKGEHVAIIGDNGTGKTTLLKILNEIIEQDAGVFKLGSNVTIGYYDQEHHVLDDSKTIFDEISDAYPTLNNTEIRNVLAAFLFTGDDVYKLISNLSGGEKGRVSLAKLMLGEANFLILDEPTNHLDIASKEILENAINSYAGTVLYVSHDRYFINRTAERILDLHHESLTEYLGDYDYYVEKKAELNVADDITEATSKCDSDTKIDWKNQKQIQAALKKLQNRLKAVEEEINNLEEEQQTINDIMADPANGTNSAKLNDCQKKLDLIDEKLMLLMEEWEDLNNQIEE